MKDPERTPLEDRLRRDAGALRGDASPELSARILAAVERESRAPRRSGRWLAAAAALALLVSGLWLARIAAEPGQHGGAAKRGSATELVARSPGTGSVGPATGRWVPVATPAVDAVGDRVRGWARSSSLMLRASVDEPLGRELEALSLDFVRVIDACVIGLPEAIARPFADLF